MDVGLLWQGRSGHELNVNHLLIHLCEPLAQAQAQSLLHPFDDVFPSGRDTEFTEATQCLGVPGFHAQVFSFY